MNRFEELLRKLTHEEVVERQKGQLKKPRLLLTVILSDIRSLYNVGSIFRTSDGAGVEKIWLCGITGHPPNNQISKTALGAEDHVPWEYALDALTVIKQLKRKNYQIILLEQVEGSLPYDRFEPDGPVCLVVGNEITGVSEDMVAVCDQCLEIEMDGIKNSLNVSVAFGVVVFHMREALNNCNALGVTDCQTG